MFSCLRALWLGLLYTVASSPGLLLRQLQCQPCPQPCENTWENQILRRKNAIGSAKVSGLFLVQSAVCAGGQGRGL